MQYKIFWCKVNKYYTDKWLNSDYLKNKKWVFIASCVVTDKAKRKWIKFIKDICKTWDIEEKEKVYISWCWAFKDGKAQEDFFILYPELNSYKEKIEVLWEDPEQYSYQNSSLGEEINKHSTSHWKEVREWSQIKIPKVLKKQIYTKKFVLIQGWCDSFCTFCLTVVKRWRHFFRDKEDIRDEILDFEKSWWKEVVLTWVNLSAWWLKTTNDIKNSKFSELLNYLLENTTIPRIRISSLWPEFIDDKCLEIFKEERIYPHFHFSVQSWSSEVLKSMRRHYDWKYIKDLLKKTIKLKRKDIVDISIWADIIVWFPWETEENFLETYNLVKEVPIQKLHAFPFSAHEMWESVPAWKFKNQIDDKTKKERIERLTELWDKVRNNFIGSQKWKTLKVLIESVKWNSWKWWTQNYIEANNENFEIIEWKIKRNEIIVWKLK